MFHNHPLHAWSLYSFSFSKAPSPVLSALSWFFFPSPPVRLSSHSLSRLLLIQTGMGMDTLLTSHCSLHLYKFSFPKSSFKSFFWNNSPHHLRDRKSIGQLVSRSYSGLSALFLYYFSHYVVRLHFLIPCVIKTNFSFAQCSRIRTTTSIYLPNESLSGINAKLTPSSSSLLSISEMHELN